jgi:hypothetical protein
MPSALGCDREQVPLAPSFLRLAVFQPDSKGIPGLTVFRDGEEA